MFDLKNKKVFIIGDSRTGTSSLAYYLSVLGFKSKHYYVKESFQKSPDHENKKENWENLKKYINESGYNAFSDYPTRLYYRNLSEFFPEAYFILSVRSSTEKWMKSMLSYFPKFNIKLNHQQILKNYEDINNDILSFFKKNDRKFIVISIDDDNKENSEKIKSFLGVDSDAVIGWENKSTDIDVEDISKRKILYKNNSKDWIRYVEKVIYPYKTLLSEKGWIFLINDTNLFYEWCYGYKSWSASEIEKVRSITEKRVFEISKFDSKYIKIIVPEKNIIYEEYMPHIFSDAKLSSSRPAKIMQNFGSHIRYLDKYLNSLKGFGHLYFRGDTHLNWLGAYYVYVYIYAELKKMGIKINDQVTMDSLNVSVAKYKGDLYTQASPSQIDDIHGVWGGFNLSDGMNYDIKYSKEKNFNLHKNPVEYLKYSEDRDVLVTEIDDSELPTAVIFRDSTCDFMVDFLSTHFKKAVYIWHKGNVYEDVIRRENPDVVINIMAERFLGNYFLRKPLC